MAVELKVPEAGESIREVQIGEWRKSDGDYVQRDEVVVVIETDKAAMELPAPASGKLTIRKKRGEIVTVGETLGTIEEAPVPAARPEPRTPQPALATSSGPQASTGPRPKSSQPPTAQPVATPSARRALAHAGIAAEQVPASGPRGRLLKEDVDRYVAENAQRAVDEPQASARGPARVSEPDAPPAAAAQRARAEVPLPPVAGPRQEEAVPMSMLRRRVAQRLVEIHQTAAMLTTFNEIDMSAVNSLRKDHGDAFEKKYGIKLGLMSFFVKASVEALKTYPSINAEIRGTDIIYRNYYDIGVAVSTDRGLVVPVLRNAEMMSFAQVEQAIVELARRARGNQLTLEELEGGTFTITNGGVFGSLMSTPILNPPQSGILGLHAIQDRPVVRDGQIVARPMMYVALTYDHRVVDGREAVSFLRRIKECVEAPARMLLEA